MKYIYAKNVQKSIIQWKQWTHGTTVYLQSKLSQGWSDHQAMSAPAVDTEHVLSYLPLWLFQVPLEIKQKQIQNKSQKDGNTTLSIRNIKEPFLKIKGCLRTSLRKENKTELYPVSFDTVRFVVERYTIAYQWEFSSIISKTAFLY